MLCMLKHTSELVYAKHTQVLSQQNEFSQHEIHVRLQYGNLQFCLLADTM